MRYALALLTHGEAPALHACLDSFAEMVTPTPNARICVLDGHGRMPPVEPLGPWQVNVLGGGFVSGSSAGFCGATGELWDRASALDEVDYVFWLENDFLFDRPVDIAEVAAVLEGRTNLAQMALLRQPMNDREDAAGGLYRSLEQDEATVRQFSDGVQFGQPHPWLEHVRYFTTNPSLMRRRFMADHPWPDYPSECEGRFGLDLAAAGFRFGIWGAGEEWVQHVGARTGRGY